MENIYNSHEAIKEIILFILTVVFIFVCFDDKLKDSRIRNRQILSNFLSIFKTPKNGKSEL